MPAIERKYDVYSIKTKKGNIVTINESTGEFTYDGLRCDAPAYYKTIYRAIMSCAEAEPKQEMLHRLVSYVPDSAELSSIFGSYLISTSAEEISRLISSKAEWKKFLAYYEDAKQNKYSIEDAINVGKINSVRKLFDNESWERLIWNLDTALLISNYNRFGITPFKELAKEYNKEAKAYKRFSELYEDFKKRINDIKTKFNEIDSSFNHISFNLSGAPRNPISAIVTNYYSIISIYEWESEYNIHSFGRTIEERYSDCCNKKNIAIREKEATLFREKQLSKNLNFENDEYKVSVPTTYMECDAIGDYFGNCAGGYEWTNYLRNGKRHLVTIVEKATNTMKVCCDISANTLEIYQYLGKRNSDIHDDSLLKFKTEYQRYLNSLR